jgi:putative glycosyltransferase
MNLSIVATLYRSESYISEFCDRSAKVARQLVGEDYEIVLVNDGSPDTSLAVAVALSQEDPHLKIIDLSRNFGHHKAMMTGLSHSTGAYIFLIDSDLEEAPEWLLDFYPQLKTEHCDVIYGVQQQRKGNLFERLTGEWFYILFRILTGLVLPRNVVTARLMTRRYVEALVSHQEREVFMAGLWHLTGFVQQPQWVTKQSSSETTYTFRRKISLLINSVTSFSNTPLIGIFYVGLTIFLVAGLFTLYLVVNRLFFARPLSGWTSVMASVWLLGGLIISFIGIIGIYLSKIFSETKQRPYTIVRQVYGKQND